MKRVLSTGDIANAGLDEDDNDRSSTQARGRRNKRTKKGVNHGQSVPSTQPNVSADDDNISITPSISSEISRLQMSVDQLSAIVHNQKLTISSLSNQLKFVLSFLGITDGELTSASHEAVADADNTDSVGHSTDIAAQAGAGAVIADGTSNTDIASQQSNDIVNQNSESEGITYASVTASNRAIRMNDGSGQPNSLREAVAAAMYVDQRDKERRAKSVVVSGLAPSTDNSDAVIFQRLCMLELGVDPAITYTRRLGTVEEGRVRPLLVSLQSADDVSRIISQAKKLRRSASDVVRNNVYINRNLTKLEARLAYEERCRRRRRHRQQATDQTSLQRRDSQQPSQPPVGAVPSTPTSAQMTISSDGRHR